MRKVPYDKYGTLFLSPFHSQGMVRHFLLYSRSGAKQYIRVISGSTTCTVLQAKSDNDVMFCLQS